MQLIPHQETDIVSISIPETSDFHKVFMDKKGSFAEEHHQFFRNRQERDMIVYTKGWWNGSHGDSSVNFYDIRAERTTVRVHSILHILYMCPIKAPQTSSEDFVIFNKFSCSIDFAAAL